MTQTPHILSDGSRYWINERGTYHREDGPAIEHRDGSKYWYVNGKLCLEKKEFAIEITKFLLNCNKEAAKIVLKLLKN
jgi:hypothetical protein